MLRDILNSSFGRYAAVLVMLFLVFSVSGGWQKIAPKVNAINLFGTEIEIGDDGVDLRSGEADLSVDRENDTVSTGNESFDFDEDSDSGERTLKIKSGDDSLNVRAQGGSLDVSSKQNIVSLEGDTEETISTDEDLEAYNQLVIETRPATKEISVSDEGVTISYRQPAKLFGFISVELGGTVEVSSQGFVEVKLPWYSFLFSNNSKKIRTEIKNNLNTAVKNRQIELATLGGSNETLRVRQGARVVNIISGTVNSGISVSSGKKTVNKDANDVPQPSNDTVVNEPKKPADTTTPSPSKTTCQIPNDFPFGNYSIKENLRPDSANGTVIARNIDGYNESRTLITISDNLNLIEEARVTNAYVFSSAKIGEEAFLANLYVQQGTTIEQQGMVGAVIRLSKSDLIRKAMVAAGLRGQECNY